MKNNRAKSDFLPEKPGEKIKERNYGKKSADGLVCSECGHESLKWMGQCICGAWNTMTEEKVLPQEGTDKRRRTGSGGTAEPALSPGLESRCLCSE